jgi:putative RNA polymerase sigma (70) factor
LASAPEELRIVWVLREVDDMSYEEISQTLNLTESTVRGRLARARSLVMRHMKEWE